MPKKTNDPIDEKKNNVKKSNTAKKVVEKKAKRTSPKQDVTTKKSKPKTSTKVSTKSSTTKVAKKTSVKTTKAKSSPKKVSKTLEKSTVKKSSSSTKKKTTTPKKQTTKRVAKSKGSRKAELTEYYDLPYRYNQTIVKILAQTPNTLFVYWDISDEDRKKYIDEFGENFFESTTPILIVHNKTMNYSFEIEINDFANSWYFNVNDAKCDYEIELGRRSKSTSINFPNNYMYVASSNLIESPNNHILFEKGTRNLFFRNVKTNATISKEFSKFDFMKYAGKIYNIYDIYRKIYKAEELESIDNMPGSNF